jgi:hypothetical protein
MRYFITPALHAANHAGTTRVRLYRLGQWTLEFDREITHDQAICHLKSGDEFITAYVYQSLFVRYVPVRLVSMNEKELLGVGDGLTLFETMEKFPESWMAPECGLAAD